jgi:site-specific DNA recombinase
MGSRIAGYVRVSSTRQAVDGDSLEAQQNAIQAEVQRRVGFKQLEDADLSFYVDAGKSAKDQNRPQWQRLRKDIAAGKIDMVICFKLDRITRSIVDFAEVWEFLEQYGVQLLCLRENFDTTNAMGRAMLHITMVFAQLERELTGERTRATMEDRAARGLWNGGFIYGYRKGEDGKLVIDAEEAKVIRNHVFDAFEDLGSVGGVTRKLRELGIGQPVQVSRSGNKRGGKPFDARQVSNMLSSPVYRGEIHWGEAICKDAHPPIIEARQFERVQKKLGENRRTHSNHRQRTEYPYILKGLVRCGKCSSIMTPYHSTGRDQRYFYYACTKRMHHKKVGCDAPYVPAPQLDQAVIERCIALSADESSRERIVRAAIQKADNVVGKLEEEIADRQRGIGQQTSEIDNLVAVLKEVGAAGLGSVKDELDKLEAQRSQDRKILSVLKKRRDTEGGVGDKARQFLEGWRSVGQLFEHATPEEQRALVRLYVEVIELVATGDREKTGKYTLVLFPEAVTGRPDPATENAGTNANGSAVADPLLSFRGNVPCELQEAPCSKRSQTKSLNIARFFKTRALLNSFANYSQG